MKRVDDKFLSLFHLSQLSGLVLPTFGSFVVPLVIWVLRKDEIYNLDFHAKAVLNFQVTILLLSILCVPLVFIGIGVLLLILLWFISVLYPIINTIRISNGESINYPFKINLF